jgi:hypothetical protein
MGILASRLRSESNAAIEKPDFAELNRSHATAFGGTPTTQIYNKNKFKLGMFVINRRLSPAERPAPTSLSRRVNKPPDVQKGLSRYANQREGNRDR